jgi:hypothetical protein
MTFPLDLYRIILIAAVAAVLGLQIWRFFFPPADAKRRQIIVFGCRPRGAPSEHGSEVLLLAGIALGLLAFMYFATSAGKEINLTACLVLLTTIVSAVEKRWSARSLDRATTALANSPPAQPPAQPPDQAQPPAPPTQ